LQTKLKNKTGRKRPFEERGTRNVCFDSTEFPTPLPYNPPNHHPTSVFFFFFSFVNFCFENLLIIKMTGHEEVDVHESREEMESLVLNDPSNGRSSSDDPLLSSASSSFNAFLDPPSYAEVIFNGHDESPRLSSKSNPRSSDYLHISISDLQKEQEISNSLVPSGEERERGKDKLIEKVSGFDGCLMYILSLSPIIIIFFSQNIQLLNETSVVFSLSLRLL